MMQEIDFYLVDAFSDRAFGGNAAAVCPLEAWLSDETLLKMAKQHNQSETAFLSERITGLSCAGLPRRMKLTSAATQPSRLLTLFLNTGLSAYGNHLHHALCRRTDGTTQRRLADA